MSGAIVIIMVYLVAQLGKCSRIHSRVAAAFGALATVGGALIVSYGLGALLTFQSSVHQVLPFLIAGIGVDDIFGMCVCAPPPLRASPACTLTRPSWQHHHYHQHYHQC